ncbi:F-box only protein 21-like isoform X2 [Periplaneta americana]|uniref:F-box only protein 21-like isoform X2 n=1 Tax=Periplaneta americana TaxID=6978 RepID=UPI0037E813E2
MASDVLISYLPNEILEYILESDVLMPKDVCNFGSTCSKFRNLVNTSNKLWKTKFQQCWPNLQEVPDRQKVQSWQFEYKSRLEFGRKLRKLVSQMSRRFHKKEEISNSELSDFGKMMQEHKYGYAYMVDELMSIAYDNEVFSNLTEKYYTEKVIRYIRQLHLKEEWQDFLTLDLEDQLLEKGAVLVAQWCQPMVEVSYNSIASQLDDIATQVKAQLFMDYPNHPLFRTPEDKFVSWRNKNISGNQWKPSDSQKIISAICNVLFQQMGFHGNNEMYYSAENSFINMVLLTRKGIPITLSIVFESVSRRLGVKCEPVSFPAHFLLRWREKYNNDECGAELSPYYYIDVFNGGQFLTKRSCPRYSPDSQCPMRGLSVRPATPIEVIERMANNLEVAGRQRTQMNGRGARLRSALELLNLVNPSDMNCILHLARFYMLYNMDLADLMATIELEPRARDQARHIMQMLQVYETHHYKDTSCSFPQIEPKVRSENIAYAVGMIMRHRQYNYRCVIYGWDSLCAASQEWIRQMGVENLPQKSHQPFYNVLVEDGSIRYAAQENLEVASEPVAVTHLDVGRYFEQFCSTYYVPNAEKRMEYPQDAEVRQRFCGYTDVK